jgi:hypothetical protein
MTPDLQVALAIAFLWACIATAMGTLDKSTPQAPSPADGPTIATLS